MIHKNLTKYFFYFLPIFLLISFGRYGFEDADTGFLMGLGWRFANGEIPYVDFSYVRPFMSIVHAALIVKVFPDFSQLFTLKIVPLLQLFFSVWLTLLALEKKYLLNVTDILKYRVAIAGYIIATSSLSYYMIWHTIDGIFYQSIGLYFISQIRSNQEICSLFFASFFLFLGVLCKQNFLATFFLSFLFVFIVHGLKTTAKYIGLNLFIISSAFLFIKFLGFGDVYFDAISSKTSISDIYSSSIYPYIKSASSDNAIIFISLSLLLFFVDKKFGLRIFYISFFIVPVFMLLELYKDLSFSQSINFRSTKLDWIIPFYAFLYIIYDSFLRKKLKDNALLILFFSLSWSSSVSWGANTPTLYFTPILVSLVYFYSTKSGKFNKHLIAAIQISAFIFMLQMLSPYRDSFVSKLNYNMGDIYPKAQYIKTDFETYEKHKEYVSLLKVYDVSQLTVLPSMPLSHYLVDAKNPYIIDWAMDVESTMPPIEMIEELKSRVQYVFIETRSIGNPIGEPGSKFYSTVSDYVINHYEPVEKKNYFHVYKLN
ncbi:MULTISPECIES: hypothetical protein [Vibrio]|uniref:Uncharacterized protein n=1 Tax=Vibrio navarrensis TaxID=29495 RepID=A0AAJ4LUS0_9VIBR|nr:MULTISPECIES: hypothetical protein [Vibrio]KJR36131.1 membrane protein [Vibrio sp. S234-5]MBE4603473.1 hypothetical protein [Vibrio navarrensis]QPL53799.1 hypothetical protein I3X05_01040 [Vibrio navarrensis]